MSAPTYEQRLLIPLEGNDETEFFTESELLVAAGF